MQADIELIVLGAESVKELEEKLSTLTPREQIVFQEGINFLYRYYRKVNAIDRLAAQQFTEERDE